MLLLLFLISSGTILKSINPAVKEDLLQKENDENEIENLQYDGLENLAGYICHKLKNKNPGIAITALDDSTYSWVNHLSEGGLSKPSQLFMETLKSCDAIFIKLNGDKLLLTSGYLQKHMTEAKEIEGRCRMYFRIRSLNTEISQHISTRKRKFNKITT